MVQYRRDIDGLRAVSIFIVVVFHYFENFLSRGYIGVDIFFVISGFLITSICLDHIDRGTFTLADFYRRRFVRILPALGIVLLVIAIIGRQTLLYNDFQSLGAHTLFSSFFASNFLLWNESGYFGPVADTKVYLNLWSLAIEEQFYLFWPLILVLVTKLKDRMALRILGALGILSFALDILFMQRDPTLTFFMLPFRFWELLMGGILGFVMVRFPEHFHALRLKFAKFSTPVIILFFLTALLVYCGQFPLAFFSNLAAVLLILQGPNGKINASLENKSVVYLGKISYPLYLWHWPLLAIANIHYGESPPVAIKLALLALSVLLSILTFEWIEKPTKRFFSLAEGRQKWVLSAGVLMLSFVATLGYAMSAGKFTSSRQLEIKNFTDPYTKYPTRWSCFLFTADASWEDFSEACKSQWDADSTLIWGDSYAGMIQYGMDQYIRDNKLTEKVATLSASGCPPILGVEMRDRPRCRDLNDSIFDQIRAKRPRTLILVANWQRCSKMLKGTEYFRSLRATILELKKMGARKIVILGQFPYWKKPLYKIVGESFLETKIFPTHLPAANLFADPYDTEVSLRKLASEEGVTFVDVYPYFCDAESCRTFEKAATDKDPDELTTFDDGHLTVSAQINVMKSVIGPALVAAGIFPPVR